MIFCIIILFLISFSLFAGYMGTYKRYEEVKQLAIDLQYKLESHTRSHLVEVEKMDILQATLDSYANMFSEQERVLEERIKVTEESLFKLYSIINKPKPTSKREIQSAPKRGKIAIEAIEKAVKKVVEKNKK